MVAQEIATGVIYLKGKVGEEEVGPNTTEAKCATAQHPAVPVEQVERSLQIRYVESILDKDGLAIEAELGCA